MDENRVSLLSVAATLWHWCLGLATLTHISWVVYISWVYSTYGEYTNVHYAIIESARNSADLLPQNIAFAVVFVAIADFIAKGGIMNTAEYVQKKFFEPSLRRHREKLRAEFGAEERAAGLEEGRAAGLEEGRAEALAQAYAEWSNWNARRMDAEAKGIPFDEPPPSLD